jgi:hypothetical protein
VFTIYLIDVRKERGMIDIDSLVIESLKEEEQRQRELEEGRRLWLPIPEPELRRKSKEDKKEPKRVIVIDI